MTFKYTTLDGFEGFIHDVIVVRQLSRHKFEFRLASVPGQKGPLVVKDLMMLSCDMRCLCHAARD